MWKQPIFKIFSVLVFVIGLGGIPDDLKQWEAWLMVFWERGVLSWMFMIAGVLMLAYSYRESLLMFFGGTTNDKGRKAFNDRLKDALWPWDDSIWEVMLEHFQFLLLYAVFITPSVAFILFLAWLFGLL